MKNKNRIKLFVILAVAITTAFAVQPAKAVSSIGYTINMIELTSTSLTVSYNGPGAMFSTPTNTGTDLWTVSYTPTANSSFSLTNFILDWTEPGEPTEVNEVSHGISFGSINNLYVASDVALEDEEYGGGIAVTVPNGTLVQVGTDAGQPVFLRFDDQAGLAETPATVPDAGSTLAFLSVSSLLLFGVAGRRSLQVS